MGRTVCPWADQLLPERLQGAAVDIYRATDAAALTGVRLRGLAAEGDVHVPAWSGARLARVLASLCGGETDRNAFASVECPTPALGACAP